MEYIEYMTKDGDRWDTISADFYGGDPLAFEQIIDANPTVMILPVLCSGITLKIPTINLATAQAVIPASELPPWKQ